MERAPRSTVVVVTSTVGTESMSVAALARRVGVKPDTIRYYEKSGLLPPAARTMGDHRRYGEDSVDRLRFIQGAQRLGLRLRQIATLLEVRDTGNCPCQPAEQLLRERIAEIDSELGRLKALRTDLVRMVGALASDNRPDPEPGKWCPPGMREVTTS